VRLSLAALGLVAALALALVARAVFDSDLAGLVAVVALCSLVLLRLLGLPGWPADGGD
jgi:hypothetical protein